MTVFELNDNDTPSTTFMSWVVRLFWTLDLVVSFLTGYVDAQGVLVVDPKKVAARYLRSHFFIDIIAVIASWVEILGDDVAGSTGLLRNIKLVRFARLLRLKRGREIFVMITEYVRAEKVLVIASVTRMMIVFLVFIHLLACMWYGISDVTYHQGHPSWIELEDIQGHGETIKMSSIAQRYTYSFHTMISLFFGENLARPYNLTERVYMVLVLYCSFVGQLWIVSSITTAMTHLEIVTANRSTMFFQLERFLTAHGISRELEMKVQRNAKHAMKDAEKSTEESTIELLKVISEPLLMDLHMEMHNPTLSIHPFFRCAVYGNAASIRVVCHRAVSVHKFQRDDIVFCVDEKPSFGGSNFGALLFVEQGELQYIRPAAELSPRSTLRNSVGSQSEVPSRKGSVQESEINATGSFVGVLESEAESEESEGHAATSRPKHSDPPTPTMRHAPDQVDHLRGLMAKSEWSSKTKSGSRLGVDEDEPATDKCPVKRGQWLSEAVLWTRDWHHVGTLRATTDCRLVALDAVLFREAMSTWDLRQVKDYAAAFVDDLNHQSIAEELTDLGDCSDDLMHRVYTVYTDAWAEVGDEFVGRTRFSAKARMSWTAPRGLGSMMKRMSSVKAAEPVFHVGRGGVQSVRKFGTQVRDTLTSTLGFGQKVGPSGNGLGKEVIEEERESEIGSSTSRSVDSGVVPVPSP
jgi:hypothetical protein